MLDFFQVLMHHHMLLNPDSGGSVSAFAESDPPLTGYALCP